MFENLDDPVPPAPAALDGVLRRGRELRLRRRLLAVSLTAFVLAGTIATAAALQADGHKKVVVSNPSSTTASTDATVPGDTSTTAPDTTAPAGTTPTPSGAVAPLTSVATTTQPPHDPHDLSMVTVVWPADTQSDSPGCPGPTACGHVLPINTGESKDVTYTLINGGSWDVQLDECASHVVDVWAIPPADGFGQYSMGIWPEPYPARGAGAVPETCAGIAQTLPAGRSVELTETIVAGYRNANGAVMPSPPGMTSFVPSFLPQCAQPCDAFPPRSLAVSVFPPREAQSLYTINVKTMNVSAASGGSVGVEMTLTNPLDFTVREPLFGPCWRDKAGTAPVDCSANLPAVVIGPHQTVDLVGTVWARKGFVATGVPLDAGKYVVRLGDLFGGPDAIPSGLVPVLTVS